ALAAEDAGDSTQTGAGCRGAAAAATLPGHSFPAWSMSRRNPFLRPLAAALLFCCIVPPATAQRVSARDKAAAEALVQRMAAAEQRYRDALVLAGNGDPRGAGEGNAALEDMEDVVDACVKLRGCPLSDLLATYKRLLKARADEIGRASCR